MSVNVKMPKLGMTMKEGKLSKWFKGENDSVQEGEELFEVETEKITNKIDSPATGILFQIVIPEGTVVPVGTVLGIIAEPGEQPERIEGIQVGEVEEITPTPSGAPEPAEEEKTRETQYISATPAAKRLAKELDIDLSQVQGTGPEGRIKEADVTRYHEQGPPGPKATPLAVEIARQEGLDLSAIAGTGEGGKITKEDVIQALAMTRRAETAKPFHLIPFTGMRKAIADNMHASLHNTAQLTLFTETDVTESIRFLDLVRQEHKKDETIRVSMNDIIILATSRALKRFPIMNSTQIGDEILLHDSVRMGIAVALPEGLIVPVLNEADKKGLLQIARESRELARKAREGTLSVDEVTDGTFTITNLSGFGVDGFTPILKPPETGILGVGRVVAKPVVSKGEIVIRSMMVLSLTIDHRVVDGALAAEFLQTVARYLEQPPLIMS
ncbi:MAG: 2-oxo acid dehydrogenase subunit E2 [Deltaproteobacteria bacterium]|nr:2-oxo acid dehydrogenase subunit E2 [Deltaproteobacteria bacterium]MBW2200092.1 2-oxo acid dehydrogenase subunit E2 [Deltaproteobacteria bacterium]MBW2539184.1 2-oxo acid dehydrogenase subunit E2 [Deltaproteobacteria bacterium]